MFAGHFGGDVNGLSNLEDEAPTPPPPPQWKQVLLPQRE